MSSRASSRRIFPALLAATLLAAPQALAANVDGQAPVPDVVERARRENGPASMPHTLGIAAETYVGGYQTTASEGSRPVLGVSAHARVSVVDLGGFAEAGDGMFLVGLAAWGGSLGVSLPIRPDVRVSVLGEFGRHSYSDVGSTGLFGRPGASGESSFVGLRLGANVSTSGRARFTFGGWLFVRADLRQQDVEVPWGGTGGWFEPAQQQTNTYRVGGVQVGAVARIGFEALVL